jgi:hypothetical protein
MTKRIELKRFNQGTAMAANTLALLTTPKTIVALHRAARLAQSSPQARVLLTTFSRPLASALEQKLKILVGEGSSVIPKIVVIRFAAWPRSSTS